MTLLSGYVSLAGASFSNEMTCGRINAFRFLFSVVNMNATSEDREDVMEDEITGKDDTNSRAHKCSLFGCRPRWLQFFAKPYWFLLFLNLFIVSEGAIVSGMYVGSVS